MRTRTTSGAVLKVLTGQKADDFYYAVNPVNSTSKLFWRFGEDNKFPQAVALLNRRSPIHRGILNAKTIHITGRQFVADKGNTALEAVIKNCDGRGTNLRDMVKRIIFDRLSFGNAYVELVRDPAGKWINFFHQDAVKCRLQREKQKIILNGEWSSYDDSKKDELKKVPLYPLWGDDHATGFQRTIVHLKSFENEFENYGLMDWFAGMGVSAIAYKTNKWNISRLDNSFHSSGVLVIDGNFENPEDAEEFQNDVEGEFTGENNQGKLLSITKTKNDGSENGSKFVPITLNYDGDWKELQAQSITELIIAHNWFRSLTSLPDNTGFDTKRIINEYNVALNTIILDAQAEILNVLKEVLNKQLGINSENLSILNMPPVSERPPYMKVWQALKADGLEYDENDPAQQVYIGSLNSATKPKENA